MKTIILMNCLAMMACAPDREWKENDASGRSGTMTHKADGSRAGPPTPVTSPTYGPMRGPMVNPNMGMR
jgi:hypothetical protein